MKQELSILNTIDTPFDLQKLPEDKIPLLIKEIRHLIIDVVSNNGGHLASNLGVVELTIALHRVFNSPYDKIIWDVGHQCYTHKIITGRRERFNSLRKFRGLSGFPKRAESPHDVFGTGHASTSISAGLGIVSANKIQEKKGKVVAVIGDGALTGGLALEALNHAGQLGKDLIIVLNDNGLSIGQNVGALSIYMTKLSTTKSYQYLRRRFHDSLEDIPIIGKGLLEFARRIKKSLKAFLFDTNFFADLGFEYVGPIGGHNIQELEHILRNIQKLEKPVVLHVSTLKGKGYSPAEYNPIRFHGIGSFSIVDGKLEQKKGLTFTDVFAKSILEMAKKDNRIVAITAAMTHATGLSDFQKKFPDRFFDLGICEQHAITFAAGLSSQGLKPVVAIYSTFMQRAVDQVIHDVSLQNLPIVICMDRAGLVGNDGETHHGVFDIPLFRPIPNLIFLSPADNRELELMLEYALKSEFPVMIRYPKAKCPLELPSTEKPIINGRGVFIRKKSGNILFISLGGTIPQVLEASILLEAESIICDVYNLRFIKPIDFEYLEDLCSGYRAVIVIEEGLTEGGIGEKIGIHVLRLAYPPLFEHIGIPNEYIEHGSREELLNLYSIEPVKIANIVKNIISESKIFTLLKKCK